MRLYMVILSGLDSRGGKRIGKRGLFGLAIRIFKRLIVALVVLSVLLAILFLLT